ncbi:ATP-dependent endonuclease [Catellatospora bangladeshensis]|uniref:ATP-dependent nuclease n=1 Tax=Catellatospora bangladeshensis TaxID=310355 RepID=UPI001940D47A|nr:AAA family ATPase [Catellatospora bangladeshensis]
MRLKAVEVRNFRSLLDVCIAIDMTTTLIVGKNNTGKTSLLDVFSKFVHVGGSFAIEDLSTVRINDLVAAVHKYAQSKTERNNGNEPAAEDLLKQALALIPSIELKLTFEYTAEDDIAPIASIILDLDESSHEAKLCAALEMAKPLEFLEETYAIEPADQLVKYIRRSFGRVFAARYYAVDAVTSSHRVEVNRTIVQKIFSTNFIYAQNKLDDSSADTTRNLSKTFAAYYNLAGADNPSVEDIENALAQVAVQLDGKYETLFKPIFDDLNGFGVDTITPIQNLKVQAYFEANRIVEGNTRLYYESGGHLLPEGYNGLGYTKLIFTILQCVASYEAYLKSAPKPSFQVLFIEEPEAHLHPQMQEVFIKNVKEYIQSKAGWNVQVIITTHSSHIVASSSFANIRYFDNSDSASIVVKDLSTFQGKVSEDADNTLRFLRQHMVLSKCDLFFADRVILVEGTVERLLLPAMIAECVPTLRHKYVSLVEVGGAYAHKFKELLTFINIPTLVITDIDSVDPSSRGKACETSVAGAVTSNATLKTWLPKRVSISDLIALPESQKVDGMFRVAYQVSEASGGKVGRSFEEAFILANAQVIATQLSSLALKDHFTDDVTGDPLSETDIQANSYEVAKSLSNKKTDLAFDIMYLSNWNVPRYIKEGLEWLSRGH